MARIGGFPEAQLSRSSDPPNGSRNAAPLDFAVTPVWTSKAAMSRETPVTTRKRSRSTVVSRHQQLPHKARLSLHGGHPRRDECVDETGAPIDSKPRARVVGQAMRLSGSQRPCSCSSLPDPCQVAASLFGRARVPRAGHE